MELGGASRDSTGFGAMEEGLMSSGGRKLRVPLHFLLGSQYSSVLAWRIPGTGEPGGLPFLALHRVGHD